MHQSMISSDNGLSHIWHNDIITANTGLLLIGPLGTNSDEILTKMHQFSVK